MSSQNVNYNSSKPYLLEDICYPKKTILRMTNIKFYYNVNTILSFYKLSVHLYEKIQNFYGRSSKPNKIYTFWLFYKDNVGVSLLENHGFLLQRIFD